MRLQMLLLLAVLSLGLNAQAAKKYTAIGDSISVGLYADDVPLPDGTYAHAFTAQVRDELIARRGYGLSDYHNRAVSNATTSNALTP